MRIADSKLGTGVSTFAPFSKGIEASRKLRHVSCGWGASAVRTTAPLDPLVKGDRPLAFGHRIPSLNKEGLAPAAGCCREGSSSLDFPKSSISALPTPPPPGPSAPASPPRMRRETHFQKQLGGALPTSGRWFFIVLLAFSFLTVPGFSAEPASVPAPVLNGTPVVQALDVIGMTVGDMDRSVEFFSNVLTFEKVSDVEVTGDDYERLQGLFGLRMRVVRMNLGGESIELTEYLAPRGRAFPSDTRSNDRWFQHVAIIVSDMDKAYRTLRLHKVQHASSGPQRLPDWNKNAGGIQAFYFRDPDGHFLEILQFPEGKGDPKWQRKDKLFLGIDHTAIVVKDTDESLKFYRDTLGMKVVGESENYDTEQEHLNNVFGARLRITALRASSGPGIEFLEYLSPRDGRPMPVDERANDILHWQTRLQTSDTGLAAKIVGARKHSFVSAGVVTLKESNLGISSGVLVRDPDGHVIELAER